MSKETIAAGHRPAAIGIDFLDPGFMADPYPALAAAREQAAVHFDPQFEGWYSVRHSDMAELLRNPRYAKDATTTPWPRRSSASTRPS
jgi:hypothetical protein